MNAEDQILRLSDSLARISTILEAHTKEETEWRAKLDKNIERLNEDRIKLRTVIALASLMVPVIGGLMYLVIDHFMTHFFK